MRSLLTDIMSDFEEKWTMHGVALDDPLRIKTPDELIAYIDSVGFLPLFRCGIDGFSVEEHVSDLYWWTEDPDNDPWYWRMLLARSQKVAYGKLFDGKMGFVSLKWLPKLANLRREGYDFDSRSDEGRATEREIRLMKLFDSADELLSPDMKRLSGIKSFEGTLQRLQNSTYLVIKDFSQRINKQGIPYGWYVASYAPPEKIWGSDMVCSAYNESPEKSTEDILGFLTQLYPHADLKALRRLVI